MADPANYHINLWPDAGGPATYLCLLCTLQDCAEAEILVHVPAVHAMAAVPTPLAADVNLVPSLLRKEAVDDRPDVLD